MNRSTESERFCVWLVALRQMPSHGPTCHLPIMWGLLVLIILLGLPERAAAEDLSEIEASELRKYEAARRRYDEWAVKHEQAEEEFEKWAATQKGYAEQRPVLEASEQMTRAQTVMMDAEKQIYIVRSVRGSGPENIEAFWRYRAAKEVFDAADRTYATVRKGCTEGTATQQQYTAAQKEFAAAAKRMKAALCELELRPTLPAAANGVPTRKELWQQWDEARHVQYKISYLRKKFTAEEDYVQALKELEQRYANHAAAAFIMMALAKAHEEAPELAAQYYSRAAEYPIESDMWGFAQQRAWQALAALYERQGKYREAIAALSKWEIRARCGTGAANSRRRKASKIWQLRLKYLKSESVLLIIPVSCLALGIVLVRKRSQLKSGS